MKLLFELRPVDHLDASVDDYRSLGLEPLGWPDDDTASSGRAAAYRRSCWSVIPPKARSAPEACTTWATSKSSSAITRTWTG